MFTHWYRHQEMSPINSRHEDSARRLSADFVARFKEQHFTPDNQPGAAEDHVKKELNELDPQHVGDLTHSMYPLFQDESDSIRYDLDPTPKASTEVPFRFTPSLLDPNSSPFAAFAAQPPGYYTPTPGGSSTLGSSLTNLQPTPKRSILQIHYPTRTQAQCLRLPCFNHISTISITRITRISVLILTRKTITKDCSLPGLRSEVLDRNLRLQITVPRQPVEQKQLIPNYYLARQVHETFRNQGITRGRR